MFNIFIDCSDILYFFLILIIFYVFYYNYKNEIKNESNKNKEKEIIDSITRRSEECPQQYPNGWLPVYDSHDLKNGQVKPIFALGRDLVIYRGTSGKAYVFDAYCPHLGANLGIGGIVVGDDIKCPFHGWQFNEHGDCKVIPGLEAIPKATIKKWRCDEVNDFIYVWHDLEKREPDWFMSKRNELDQLYYRGKYNKKVYCHIQDIVENNADMVHLDTVHGTEATLSRFLAMFIQIKVVNTAFRIETKQGVNYPHGEFQFFLKIGCLSLPTIFSEIDGNGPANITVKFNWNYLVKIELLANYNVITLGENRQLFVLKWYSQQTILGFILGYIMVPLSGPLFNPDLLVWNSKYLKRNPIFTNLDEKIILFRRWYKQFYSSNLKAE